MLASMSETSWNDPDMDADMSELPTGTVTFLLADVEGSRGCGRPSPRRCGRRRAPRRDAGRRRRTQRRRATRRAGRGRQLRARVRPRRRRAWRAPSSCNGRRWPVDADGRAHRRRRTPRRGELHRPDDHPLRPPPGPWSRRPEVLSGSTDAGPRHPAGPALSTWHQRLRDLPGRNGWCNSAIRICTTSSRHCGQSIPLPPSTFRLN